MTTILSPNKKYGGAILAAMLFLCVVAGTVQAVGTYTNTPRSSTVVYWHFNNNTTAGENSTRVFDFSTVNKNNGTIDPNAYINLTASYLGDGAMTYSGNNGSARTGSTVTGVNWNTSWSVGAWAKTNKTSTQQDVVSKYFRTFELGLTSGNQAVFTVWYSNVFGNSTSVTYPIITPTEWHRYVGIYNGTHILLAIDGFVVNSSAVNFTNNLFLSTDPMQVGQRSANSLVWNGWIDELVFDNTSINSSDLLDEFRMYVGNCSGTPTTQCSVPTGVTYLTPGTYNLETFGGVNTTGVMRFTANDSILDCVGATIGDSFNNTENNAIFFENGVRNNLTVRNCKINGFYYGINKEFPAGSGRTNVTINNNTFTNIQYMGVNADNFDDSIITNNTFTNVNYTGIRIHSADRTVASLNYMNLTSVAFAGIFNDGRFNTVANNTMVASSDTNALIRVEQDGSFNNNGNVYVNNTLSGNDLGYGFVATEYHYENSIINNSFTHLKFCLQPKSNLSNFTGNTLSYCNRGFTIGSTDGSTNISNNTISHTSIGFRITGVSGTLNNSIMYNNMALNVTTPFSNDNSANVTIGFNLYGNSTKNVLSGATASYATLLLRNTLAFYYNLTPICTNVGGCTTAPMNLPANNYTFIIDDFVVRQGSQLTNTPISSASSSSNVRTITSNLTSTVTNVTVILNTSGIVPSSPLLVHPDGSSEYPSYLYDSTAGTITFNATIHPGNNILYLSTVPNTPQQASACNSSNAGFVAGIGFLGLLLLIIMAAGAVMIFNKVKSGEKVSDVFDWVTDGTAGVVILSFILVFAIVIVTALVVNC